MHKTLLAEETGWHIGDGSMNYYLKRNKLKGLYQLRGHIVDDRQHYLARIKPVFDEVYGTNISLRDMRSTSVFGFQLWNDTIVEKKRKLGLPLGKKTNIEIPAMILESKKYSQAFVRGMFDTDGNIYLEPKNNKFYPRIKFSTISQPLANQLLTLLQNLHYRATMYVDPVDLEKRRPHEEFIIEIRGDLMTSSFFEEIKPQNSKHVLKFEAFKKAFKHT